jgi:hypothetical protein
VAHKLFTEDAFSDVDNNRQLLETINASVPGRLRQYGTVEGRESKYLTLAINVTVLSEMFS